MKSYTDIEQSKKLAEILPIESADMHYAHDYVFNELEFIPTITEEDDHFILFPNDVRCWSLAALLDVLPEGIIKDCYAPNLQKENSKYSIAYGNEELLCTADNPVDACVEMIIKLHELKML